MRVTENFVKTSRCFSFADLLQNQINPQQLSALTAESKR